MKKIKLVHLIYSILFLVIIFETSCSKKDGIQKAVLIKHIVTADDDGHPLALWEKSAKNATEAILLVHGRTWSALPDFDLQVEGEDLSLMDGLVAEGYAVFAVDMRGYGATPRDETEWLTPDKAARDLANVLAWLDAQNNWTKKPHLFGWSMGSTNAHLMAQQHPELISSLTLFGYWHDLDQPIPPDPEGYTFQKIVNTAEAAASDFIVPGSISQQAIDTYVRVSLAADPIKVDYKNLDQYNALDPAKITTPTLVIQGEFDPIAPTDRQAKLYIRLNTGHKQWVTVPGGDHAAFMETPRPYFIHALVSFLQGIAD